VKNCFDPRGTTNTMQANQDNPLHHRGTTSPMQANQDKTHKRICPRDDKKPAKPEEQDKPTA
jgi:hypothetical protein